ncbi:MAG: helix-turn-helix transcriptional regulator [Ruminococcaceae bacterium]|nr:helix-turn-helix transcriptional regulator [Oscillospiraceae bacterium]
MKRECYKKKFGTTELIIEHFLSDLKHYEEDTQEQNAACFVFVMKGTVTFSSDSEFIKAVPRSLLYVPKLSCYQVSWSGDKGIEYYCIHDITKTNDFESKRYRLSLLPQLSNAHTLHRFVQIFDLFSSKDVPDKFYAISLYYSFYAEALLYLTEEQPKWVSEPVACAIAFIKEHYTDSLSMDMLAEHVYISKSHLHHLFKKELNTTPIKYINLYRIEQVSTDLRNTKLSIEEISERHGFESVINMRKVFKRIVGSTPSEYRKITAVQAE